MTTSTIKGTWYLFAKWHANANAGLCLERNTTVGRYSMYESVPLVLVLLSITLVFVDELLLVVSCLKRVLGKHASTVTLILSRSVQGKFKSVEMIVEMDFDWQQYLSSNLLHNVQSPLSMHSDIEAINMYNELSATVATSSEWWNDFE